jgi:tetratricopeptide (TPR) repeat protein
VRVEKITLPTYLPGAPDKNPMFLERRVYQGSSGRVYPLPFTDRIAEVPVDRAWTAVWIENEYLRALVLPEIGGRVHILQDKTNGYDLVYRQPVIKPALVGLAGPWISGGIEFNWPQHHRPATFLPLDFDIEEHPDGAKTIWCSDHDPMARMKGMHGVCLRPGRAYLELMARAYNRSPLSQTFLWWANVATQVHEAYQSFFPTDVYYVADHARRSTSEYPLCRGRYYGVDYGRRAQRGVPKDECPRQFIPPHCGGAAPLDYAPNDLSFYANIPVPTSYMCMESKEDFFGGYDHRAAAGILHYADHHIAPGKKQWTWGNHEFGYAWDRNLTDPAADGNCPPYIELMAGVYTDNQPDFSFLHPGETKTWSQYWYPLREIGPVQQANLNASVSVRTSGRKLRVGVNVTREHAQALVTVSLGARRCGQWRRDLSPARPLSEWVTLPKGAALTDINVRVCSQTGEQLLSYRPKERTQRTVPPPATEPPLPKEISSADELYVTGLHLEQYRHATRSPVAYWQEALRRDPLDARCNNALGLWRLRRGEFTTAEVHFRNAIRRLTRRNANPFDGEPFYNLGLCLRYLGRDGEAYTAFSKAAWNQAWKSASHHALAEIDCTRQAWTHARDHLNRALDLDADNLRVRNLKVIVLRTLGENVSAESLLRETRQLDRLDCWARHLGGQRLSCDLQVRLDIAHDYARAGCWAAAAKVLAEGEAPKRELPDQSWGAQPMIDYTLGWIEQHRGNTAAALRHFNRAATLAPDYCFPARLEEIAILHAAMRANPADARAPYYLGNLLYDRRRHDEPIQLWERSARLDPRFPTVWRNLGIGYFNVLAKTGKARAAYNRALHAAPEDARLLYERDQLWKRLRVKPDIRLRELHRHERLVQTRDDLSVEFCALLNQTGQHRKAADFLARRKFQPWEGGEGGPLGQHVRAQLALGRQALSRGAPEVALAHFQSALSAPFNLGEAKHILANQSDFQYWLGCAYDALEQPAEARRQWRVAAMFRGDFQEMSVRAFSEMTYYSARAWQRLGQTTKAGRLFRELLLYAVELEQAPAKIDYFATSLPTMLLFEDDLSFRQKTSALFLQAQARLGLGQRAKARALLRTVLRRDPNHPLAADFFRIP